MKMLVVTRRVNQRITLFTELAGEIEILIVRAQDGKVRLGIDAPEGVKILRNELIEEAEEETLIR